jgi:hypothetical protein
MSKHKGQTGELSELAKTDNENKTFDVPFAREKYSPMEWLQYIAAQVEQMADMYDEDDSDFIKYMILEDKRVEPKKKTIERYEELDHYINESFLHDYAYAPYDILKNIEENRDGIVKADFANNVIYPILLKAIGIVETVRVIVDEYEYGYQEQLYFSNCSNEEEVKQWFQYVGNKRTDLTGHYFSLPDTIARFNKKQKLTIKDYEKAFDFITGLIKKIKERRYSAALRESVFAIRGYCKLKDINYSETQIKIAKRHEIAYQSFQYAIEKTGDNLLTDKQAYYYLKEHGTENIEGFELKDFDTWQRYVRGGRRHHGTPKNTFRAGRACRSAVKISEVDAKQITNQLNNSTDTD